MEELKVRLRNKILPAAILLLFSLQGYAWHVKSDSTVFLRAQGGLYANMLKNFPGNSLQNYYSFYASVDAFLELTDEFSLITGISYIDKGYILNENWLVDNYQGEPVGNFDELRRFENLSIPLSLRYNFGTKFNVYLEGGLRLDFLLKARHMAQIPDSLYPVVKEDNYREEKTISGDYHRIGLAAFAGTGIEYHFKPSLAVFAELRYSCDLTKLYKKEVLPDYSNAHFQSYSISLGIKIGIPIRYTVH